MTKAVKIILYVAILIFVYFSIISIYKSCSSRDETIDKIDNQTSVEEDDFFEDFESEEDNSSDPIDIKEPKEIDYKSLDEKLKGGKDNTKNSFDKDEEEKRAKKRSLLKKVKRKVSPTSVPQKKTPKPTPNYSGKSGSYLLVAGSFLVEQNARNLVSKLKKMGYSDAEIAVFDESRYHTVIASRSNSQSEAIRLKTSLKNRGVDCYVHTRQE